MFWQWLKAIVTDIRNGNIGLVRQHVGGLYKRTVMKGEKIAYMEIDSDRTVARQ